MIWKSYLYNNKAIWKKSDDFNIYLNEVDWRNLKTSDEEQNLFSWHGVLSSPTFARSRIISISGIIDSKNNDWISKALNYLDNLFVLQEDFEELEENIFSVIDESDKLWQIKCKIKEPVNYIISENDNVDKKQRKFKVVLEAPNPKFYGINKSYSWSEGIYWGKKMWLKLWTKLNSRFNIINVESEWNQKTPAKIELKIKNWKVANAPIKIKNLTNSTVFEIKKDFHEWDIIIIDTENKKLTMNWDDILIFRWKGSLFPTIKWKTSFIIEDNDSGLYENDFDIKIYFSDILL